nr:IS5 family transposase [Salinisphaera halophila]
MQSAGERRRRARRQRWHRPHKRGLNTKLHLAVDAHGMPLRILATQGARADCAKADELIRDFEAEHLIADKGYDSNAIVSQARAQGMQVQVPSRVHRKNPRALDAALYRHRHLVENAFEQLKRWRGLATRYAKRLSSFLAQAQIACLCLWLKIS